MSPDERCAMCGGQFGCEASIRTCGCRRVHVDRRAVNFYLWRSEEWARMFFNDQMVERVTDL